MSQARAGQTRDRVFRFVRDRLLAGDPQTVRAVQQVFGFRTLGLIRFGGHLPKGEYDVDHDGHEGQADAAELHG